MAKTLRMKTGVRQIRENERSKAILTGMSAPVKIAVRRRKSIAPLRAAACSTDMEAAMLGDAVEFMDDMMDGGENGGYKTTGVAYGVVRGKMFRRMSRAVWVLTVRRAQRR